LLFLDLRASDELCFAKASDELLVIIDVTSSVCSSCLGNRSVTLGREENFGIYMPCCYVAAGHGCGVDLFMRIVAAIFL
jgi:hypothetical protein